MSGSGHQSILLRDIAGEMGGEEGWGGVGRRRAGGGKAGGGGGLDDGRGGAVMGEGLGRLESGKEGKDQMD